MAKVGVIWLVAREQQATARLKESITLSPKLREESVMPFTGVANSEQVRVLSEALEEFCRSRGIDDVAEREYVAQLVLGLFGRGTSTLDGLLAGLDATYGPALRKA